MKAVSLMAAIRIPPSINGFHASTNAFATLAFIFDTSFSSGKAYPLTEDVKTRSGLSFFSSLVTFSFQTLHSEYVRLSCPNTNVVDANEHMALVRTITETS